MAAWNRAPIPPVHPTWWASAARHCTLNNNAYSSEIGWTFPTPRSLNNGSSSYSQTGTWSANSGGFSGTYGTASRRQRQHGNLDHDAHVGGPGLGQGRRGVRDLDGQPRQRDKRPVQHL